MDLTMPYTFYPLALPHWIAWTLFLVAMSGGIAAGVARGRGRGWPSGLRAGLIGGVGLLVVTVVVSMVITFFVRPVGRLVPWSLPPRRVARPGQGQGLPGPRRLGYCRWRGRIRLRTAAWRDFGHARKGSGTEAP
jgi:hypothetical protein